MLVKSLTCQYEVLNLIDKAEGMERFCCRKIGEPQEYYLVRILKKDWITATVAYFMKEKSREKFTEFEDCFVDGSILCLTFAGCQGISLEEKWMIEEGVLEERLEIFASVLARLTMLDMEYYFAWDCLRRESIYCTPGLSVTFLHRLEHPENYSEYGWEKVKERILELFMGMFREELKLKNIPALNRFCKNLKEKGGGNYLQVYEQFSVAKKQALGTLPEERQQPQTTLFRLWNKAVKLLKPIKRLIVVMMVAASLVYLVYSAGESQSDGKKTEGFDYIGSLEIRD